MTNNECVVITGMGAITPVGFGCMKFFSNLLAGKSGISRISLFDSSKQLCQIAGEVKNYEPDNYFDRKTKKRTGRYTQFSMIAAREAINQSGLDLTSENDCRIFTVISSAIGDFVMIEQQMNNFFKMGPGKMSPFTVPRVSSSMASANICIEYGLTGPSFGLSSACATGSLSIALAYIFLKSGFADVVLAGGAESSITPAYIESYLALRALSTRNDEPTRASRPFDRDRDGFVIGEGAGVLVLETLRHAKNRGAKILAELLGIGMSCDAYHLTATHPNGAGAVKAMKQALDMAHLKPQDIDYINAHGTSTQLNDPIETKAIKEVFGQYAYKIPISSIKSMTGHCIAASGAIEAIATIMAMNCNSIPPTVNLDNPDPLCDLDFVPNTMRKQEMVYSMSNSFAFGGQNCVLIFKKTDFNP